MVTKGEWTEKLRGILKKYPSYLNKVKIEGRSCSVVGLVRVVRNLVAHVEPTDVEHKLFEEITQQFDWLIMHCFSFWARVIIQFEPSYPTLSKFAIEFQKDEAVAMEKALAENTIEKPKTAPFIIQVCRYNASPKKMIIFNETHCSLKNLLEKAEKLKVPLKRKVSYMGVYEPEPARDSPNLEEPKILVSTESLSALNLDPLVPHLIKVEEEQMQVRIRLLYDSKEEDMQISLWSDEKFLHVKSLVKEKTGKELRLFRGKKSIKDTESVKDEEVVAMDEEARDKFFR